MNTNYTGNEKLIVGIGRYITYVIMFGVAISLSAGLVWLIRMFIRLFVG